MSDQHNQQQTHHAEREISRHLLRVYEIFGMFDGRDDQAMGNIKHNKEPLVAANERRAA
jgi:hypothetical protein